MSTEFQIFEIPFRLDSFKFTDEGLYECEHSNDIEPAGIRNVIVRGEANSLPNISKPSIKNVILFEGDDINLVCHCEMCEPLEVLLWSHENQNHQNETNSVSEAITSDEYTNRIDYQWKIENITVNNSGIYTCYMKNAYGFDTYSIELNVKEQMNIEKFHHDNENTYQKCIVNKLINSVMIETKNGNSTIQSHVYDCSISDMNKIETNILLLGKFIF